MKVRLLDRLILGEALSYLAFGVALFTTILVAMQELQPLTSMVVEHHVPLWTALRIFGLSLPYFMSLAFPMSMLLSIMLAFGRLSGDSETTALLSAGVSVRRMAVPVAVLGLTISMVTIGFNELVAPVATRLKNRIYDSAISAGVPSNRPLHFEQTSGGRTVFFLRADNYDSETKKLVRPTLVYYVDGKPAVIEWAREGVWLGGLQWELRDGGSQQINTDPNSPSRLTMTFTQQDTRLGMTIDELLTASQDPNALTYRQLLARIASKIKQHRTATDVNTDEVTLYSKISIPFACLVFALVGYPLGIRRTRSGSAVGFALSIAIIFCYYLIYQYASILGNNGAIPPLLSAWIPDVLGCIAALLLFRKVAS